MFVSKAIIGGGASADVHTTTFDRTDPSSGDVITRAAACDVAMAGHAANAAASTFPAWAGTDAAVRADTLRSTATHLGERTDELAAIAAKEVGATPSWTAFNIQIAQATLRHAASLADAIGESRYTAGGHQRRYTKLTKPVGVVLGIAPWNAPVTLAVRAIAAPLALGNTVVLKGSELCPRTHEIVAQAFLDGGVPKGAINYVVNAPDDAHAVVDALVAHPAVRRVNFTGSSRAGREVAMMAARHLKKCLLELSGKAPMIVLEGADLSAAAATAAEGAFFNQGQICMSTDRIIVEEAIANDFVAALAVATAPMRISDMSARPGPMGQLISADAGVRLNGLIDDATRKGAHVVTGGETNNTVMQPTILDHVDFGMRIYSEETFGPVLSVIRVGDADEAITVANGTDYALVAAVFCDNQTRAWEVARQIEAGVVHINGSTVYDDPTLPFGGLKASGYGRFGGLSAVHEFTETTYVTEPAA